MSAGEEFFVAARQRGTGAVALLLGPYDTRADADKNGDRGRDKAIEADRWAVRFDFGTVRLQGADVGKHVGRFGT